MSISVRQSVIITMAVMIMGVLAPMAAAAENTSGQWVVQQEANSNVEQEVTVTTGRGDPSEQEANPNDSNAATSNNSSATEEERGDERTWGEDGSAATASMVERNHQLLLDIKDMLGSIMGQLQVLVQLVTGFNSQGAVEEEMHDHLQENNTAVNETTEDQQTETNESEPDQNSSENDTGTSEENSETTDGSANGTFGATAEEQEGQQSSNNQYVSVEQNANTNIEQNTDVIVIGPWEFENPINTFNFSAVESTFEENNSQNTDNTSENDETLTGNNTTVQENSTENTTDAENNTNSSEGEYSDENATANKTHAAEENTTAGESESSFTVEQDAQISLPFPLF